MDNGQWTMSEMGICRDESGVGGLDMKKCDSKRPHGWMELNAHMGKWAIRTVPCVQGRSTRWAGNGGIGVGR